MATNTIAEPPFGQAVATQKSSTAPIVTNARAALTTAGSQSGDAWPDSRDVRQAAGPGHRRAAPIRRARALCRQAPWPFRRRAAAAMACRSVRASSFAPPPRKRAAGSRDRQSSASAELGSHADRSSAGMPRQDSFHGPLAHVVRQASQMCRNCRANHPALRTGRARQSATSSTW